MMKLLRKSKGQTITEYAILLIVVIGSLLAIQVYIKRGVQGRLKSAADDIGEQFSPGNTNATSRVYSFSQSRETVANGVTRSELTSPEITTVNATQAIHNVQQEYWGN